MKKTAPARAIRKTSVTPTPIPAAAPDESPWEVLLFPMDPTLDCVEADVDEDVVEEELVAEADAEAGDDDVVPFYTLVGRSEI
jgi:hypothetical protein